MAAPSVNPPPPAPPNGAWPGTPPYPPAAPPAAPRRWLLPVAALAVAAVLLVVGLLVAGVGPFAPSGSGTGNDSTFSEAAAVAQRTAQSYGAGSWSLLYAVGVVFGSNFSTAVNASSLLTEIPTSECTVTTTAEFPTSITQSAANFNRSTGGAQIWGFLLRNVNDSGLVVWVRNGVGQPLVTLSGGICTTLLGLIQPIPSGTVDSSVAVRAALNAGGYAFLRAHPAANMSMAVHGSASVSLAETVPGNWSVSLETCDLAASSTPQESGAEFNAQVGVTSGQVLGTPVTNQTGCSSSGVVPITNPNPSSGGATPIGTALAMSSFAAGTGGSGSNTTYYDTASIDSAAGGLYWSNVSFDVVSPSGGLVTGPLNITVLGACLRTAPGLT